MPQFGALEEVRDLGLASIFIGNTKLRGSHVECWSVDVGADSITLKW